MLTSVIALISGLFKFISVLPACMRDMRVGGVDLRELRLVDATNGAERTASSARKTLRGCCCGGISYIATTGFPLWFGGVVESGVPKYMHILRISGLRLRRQEPKSRTVDGYIQNNVPAP